MGELDEASAPPDIESAVRALQSIGEITSAEAGEWRERLERLAAVREDQRYFAGEEIKVPL